MQVIIVDGPSWRTALSDVPDRRVHKARIRHDSKSRGYYPLERVYGDAEVYQVIRGRLPVTYLERKDAGGSGWQVWGLDDPINWWGAEQAVRRLPPGRVVLGGLGLGLALHHLRSRADIESITVVEIDADVIELVTPTLPRDPRVEVVCDDYYEYVKATPPPDGVFWDIYTGTKAETLSAFADGRALTEASWPSARLVQLGV